MSRGQKGCAHHATLVFLFFIKVAGPRSLRARRASRYFFFAQEPCCVGTRPSFLPRASTIFVTSAIVSGEHFVAVIFPMHPCAWRTPTSSWTCLFDAPPFTITKISSFIIHLAECSVLRTLRFNRSYTGIDSLLKTDSEVRKNPRAGDFCKLSFNNLQTPLGGFPHPHHNRAIHALDTSPLKKIVKKLPPASDCRGVDTREQ